MKRYITLFIFLVVCIMCSKCISKKKLVYFQDVYNNAQYTTTHEEYLLKQGDVLSVTINTLVTVNDMNRYTDSDSRSNMQPILSGYTISDQGTIELPVIGKIEVEGLTIDQARNKTTQLIGEYFRDASVRVHLLTYNISVLGEVSRPGMHTIYSSSVNLLDGLALSGDLLPTADRENITLLRKEGGKLVTYKLDLLNSDLLTSGSFYLKPDDVIYVAPSRFRNINPLAPYSIAISGLSLIVVVLNTLVLK